MKKFSIYKLRTLEISEDPGLSIANRSYSKLGKTLRRWSLDEIPQIYNVVIGDMSFVGPRPLPIDYDAIYNDLQMHRFECKPGITGWAQINGRNDISWDEKFQYDNWYVDNLTFSLDLKIIFRTIIKIFRSDGQMEMPVFTGSKVY